MRKRFSKTMLDSLERGQLACQTIPARIRRILSQTEYYERNTDRPKPSMPVFKFLQKKDNEED